MKKKKHRCLVQVHRGNGSGGRPPYAYIIGPKPCKNPATVMRKGGWFCGIHNPDTCRKARWYIRDHEKIWAWDKTVNSLKELIEVKWKTHPAFAKLRNKLAKAERCLRAAEYPR